MPSRRRGAGMKTGGLETMPRLPLTVGSTYRPREPVDWAKVSDKQMIEADKGLADRLAIWVHTNEALGRQVTVRRDYDKAFLVYEAWEVPPN